MDVEKMAILCAQELLDALPITQRVPLIFIPRILGDV